MDVDEDYYREAPCDKDDIGILLTTVRCWECGKEVDRAQAVEYYDLVAEVFAYECRDCHKQFF